MTIADSCLGCTIKKNPDAAKTLFANQVQENYSIAAMKSLADLRQQIDCIPHDCSHTPALLGFIRDLNALHHALNRLKKEYPSWMIYSIAKKTESMLVHLSALNDHGGDKAEVFQINANRIVLEYQRSVKQLFILNQQLNIKNVKKDQLLSSLVGSIVGALLGGILGPIGASCGAGIGCFVGNKTALLFSNRFFKKVIQIENTLEKKIDNIISKAREVTHEIKDEDIATVLLFN